MIRSHHRIVHGMRMNVNVGAMSTPTPNPQPPPPNPTQPTPNYGPVMMKAFPPLSPTQYKQRNYISLLWRHTVRDGVSNHHLHDCLLSRLFRRRSKKTSKPRVTALWVGNSPVTGEFPAQRASNLENISIWWRHRVTHGSFNHSQWTINDVLPT